MKRRELLMRHGKQIAASAAVVMLAGCSSDPSESPSSSASINPSAANKTQATTAVANELAELHTAFGNELARVEARIDGYTGIVGEEKSDFVIPVSEESLEKYESQLQDIDGQGTESQSLMINYMYDVLNILEELHGVESIIRTARKHIAGFETGVDELTPETCIQTADSFSTQVSNMDEVLNSLRAYRNSIPENELNQDRGLSYNLVNRVIVKATHVIEYFRVLEITLQPLSNIIQPMEYVLDTAPDDDENESLAGAFSTIQSNTSEAATHTSEYNEENVFYPALKVDIGKFNCVSQAMKQAANSMGKVITARMNNNNPRIYVMDVLDTSRQCDYEFFVDDFREIALRYIDA